MSCVVGSRGPRRSRALLWLFAILAAPAVFAANVPVFTQPPDSTGALLNSAWVDPNGSDADMYAYDNFTLPQNAAVTEVRWRGGYQHAAMYGKTQTFSIVIYESIAGGSQPHLTNPQLPEIYLAWYDVPNNAGESPAGVVGGVQMYDYAYVLPTPFQASAGTKYWIRIEAAQTTYPDWCIAGATGGDGRYFRFSTGAAQFSYGGGDAAFTLLASSGASVTIGATASPAAGGTISGAGAYPLSSTASLTATPNAGYGFARWSEGTATVSTAATYSFTATANRTLVANFVAASTIAVSAAPAIGGTASGAGVFNNGTTVTVAAFPSPGYRFESWTDGGAPVSTAANYSFTAAGSRVLVANFVPLAGSVTFDLDTGTPALTTGQGIPLAQTVGGLTATFSSPEGLAFSVQTDQSTGWRMSRFSGHYFMDNNLNRNRLDIALSKAVTGISLTFATADFQQVEIPTSIQLTAWKDAKTNPAVGTATSHGTYAGDTMPMGTLTYSSGGAPFNLVELVLPYQAAGATDFLVDNITVFGIVPPPPTLTAVTVSPTGVFGGTVATGTVRLSGNTPTATVVALSSSNTAAATVPSSVTVPAGVSTATFAVTSKPVAASTAVSLSAVLAGVTKTVTLTVLPPDLSSLTVPASLVAGQNGSGSVTLNGKAPSGGTTVTLSSNLAAVTVPATVAVAAGATSATFTLTTKPWGQSATATISAKLGGTTKSAAVALTSTAVAADQSTAAAAADVIGADNETTTLLVTLKDAAGRPIAGLPAAARSLSLVFSPTTAVGVTGTDSGLPSDAAGRYAVTLKGTAPTYCSATVTAAGVKLPALFVTVKSVFTTVLPAGRSFWGVPFRPLKPAPSALYGAGGWQLNRLDPATNAGVILLPTSPANAFFNTVPGSGCWATLAAPITVRLLGDPVAKAVFVMPLSKGWNYVANPYNADWAFDLGAIHVFLSGRDQGLLSVPANQKLVSPFVWVWDAALHNYRLISPLHGGSNVIPRLAAFQAQALVSGVELRLLPPASLRERATPLLPSSHNWSVALLAHGSSGPGGSLTLGVNDAVAARLAIEAPPDVLGASPGLGVMLSADRAAAGVLDPSSPAAAAWDLVCRNPHGGDVTLSWPGLAHTVPPGVAVTLTDPQNGRSVLLNSAACYSFTSAAGSVRRLRLSAAASHVTRSEVLSLAATPNRGGGLAVTLALSAPAEVNLVIQGLGGRLVRQLNLGRQPAGIAAAAWDGRDETGRAVPAGSYRLELTAVSADGAISRAVRTVTWR